MLNEFCTPENVQSIHLEILDGCFCVLLRHLDLNAQLFQVTAFSQSSMAQSFEILKILKFLHKSFVDFMQISSGNAREIQSQMAFEIIE